MGRTSLCSARTPPNAATPGYRPLPPPPPLRFKMARMVGFECNNPHIHTTLLGKKIGPCPPTEGHFIRWLFSSVS